MFNFSFFKSIFNFDRIGYVSKLSKKGKDFLKVIESLRLFPYDDRTGAPLFAWNKYATIGYGHLIQAHEWDALKDGINQVGASSIFNNDLKIYEKSVCESIGKIPVSKNEFDALVLFCYNIGVNGFKRSSVLKIILGKKMTNYVDLNSAWMAWNKSDGKVNEGLVNRRKAELDIYFLNKYEFW